MKPSCVCLVLVAELCFGWCWGVGLLSGAWDCCVCLVLVAGLCFSWCWEFGLLSGAWVCCGAQTALRGWRKMWGGHAAEGKKRTLFAHFGPETGKLHNFLLAMSRTKSRVFGRVTRKKSCVRARKIKAVLNSNAISQNWGRQKEQIFAPPAFH